MRARGFTLIEMMVVVGIIGILATLAIGFGGDMLKDRRFITAARDAYGGLLLARTAAITQGKRGVVTFNNGQYIAFVDKNSNLVYDAGTDNALKSWPGQYDPFQGQSPAVQFTGTFVAVAGKSTAIFDSAGFCVDDVGAMTTSMNTVTVNDVVRGKSIVIEVTPGGATRIRKEGE